MGTNCHPPPNTLLFTKANILIDQKNHARLADFGLLTIIPDTTNPTAPSSSVRGGTPRWMSPELLDPQRFGFECDHQPTKESDCYAFGMVIYEVVSGRVPLAPFREFVLVRKITDGERPERPDGVDGGWFTDDLWGILNQCWETEPESRPSVEIVLKHLEQASNTWKPPPLQAGEGAEMEEDLDLTTSDDPSGMIPHFGPHRFVSLGRTRRRLQWLSVACILFTMAFTLGYLARGAADM